MTRIGNFLSTEVIVLFSRAETRAPRLDQQDAAYTTGKRVANATPAGPAPTIATSNSAGLNPDNISTESIIASPAIALSGEIVWLCRRLRPSPIDDEAPTPISRGANKSYPYQSQVSE